MPFDLSTAKPVGGFDLSTAKPVGDLESFDLESFDPAGEQPLVEPKPEPTLSDEIIGLGEAGLTAATGATTGLAGGVLGAAGQIGRELISGEFGTPEAAQRVYERSQELQQAFTKIPQTEVGQKRVQQLGELAEGLAGLPPAIAEIGRAHV